MLFSTTFQFMYTTLFGAYVTYSFIKTASLPGVVVVHSFCNWMGLPNLNETLDAHAAIRDGYRYGLLHEDLKEKWMVRWYSKIVGVAFGVGIVGFGLGFGKWCGIFPEADLLRQFVV